MHAWEVAAGGSTLLALLKPIDVPFFSTSQAVMIITIKLLCQVAIVVVQPLKFKHHVWQHIPVSIFMLLSIGSNPCPYADRQADVSVVETCDRWIVQKLDVTAKWMLRVVYHPVTEPNLGWTVRHHCLQLNLFAQVFAGYGILCYVVWWLERQNRILFIKSLSVEETEGEIVHELSAFHKFVHLVYALLVFAISWRCFVGLLSK